MTSRHYCLTFFKKPTVNLPKGVRYAIYGEEICPSSGKTHWQSYVELESPCRATQIKKLYNDNTVHIEARRGTRDQAKEYCMKDKKYEEHGKWIKGQGHRTDLETIVEQMKEGKPLSEIMMDEPTLYCKYRNGLKDIAGNVTKTITKEFRKIEVELICGPTGVGKTRKAVESSPNYYKIEGSNLQWFQDYELEKTLIIDEYNNDVGVTKMLNILDGYQLRLPVKGGHTYANWTKVIITTNLRPEELHSNAKQEHRAALFRRITTITNLFPNDGE